MFRGLAGPAAQEFKVLMSRDLAGLAAQDLHVLRHEAPLAPRLKTSRSRVVFIQFLHALSGIVRSLRAVGCCLSRTRFGMTTHV